MLDEDAEKIVECAKKMVWLPVPTETYPFWEMEE